MLCVTLDMCWTWDDVTIFSIIVIVTDNDNIVAITINDTKTMPKHLSSDYQ